MIDPVFCNRRSGGVYYNVVGVPYRSEDGGCRNFTGGTFFRTAVPFPPVEYWIMGIYTERKINIGVCFAILIAAFAVLFGVWLFVGPELMRSEVIYASAAAEFSFKKPLLVTIHGWSTAECMPLLPAVARLLRQLTGAPMESVLRGFSILMLAAGAGLVYLASGGRGSPRAGLVAAAMYSSCFLALGTAIEGTPATCSAFFLAAAQWVFFQYGIRRADWNRAWVLSALLALLGFHVT